MSVGLVQDGVTGISGSSGSLGLSQVVQNEGQSGHHVGLDPLVHVLAESLDHLQRLTCSGGVGGGHVGLEGLQQTAGLEALDAIGVDRYYVDSSKSRHRREAY